MFRTVNLDRPTKRARGLAGLAIGILFGLLVGCGAPPQRATPTSTSSVRLEFELSDLDGAKHALVDPEVSTVLVFWATFCGPCRRELPDLARASAELGERIRFLGIISGPDDRVDEEKARRLVKNAGVKYPQLRDRDGDIARHFEVEGTPTLVIVGSDGSTRYRGTTPPRSWASYVSH